MTTVKASILRGVSVLLMVIAATIALRYWRRHTLFLLPDDIIVVAVFTLTVGIGVVLNIRRQRRQRRPSA